MLFDFNAFLAKLDPFSAYEINKLTGGLINLTVRAVKTNSIDHGAFPGKASLILKFAPPFVAAVGPDAPFSQKRQLVEAAALSLFHSEGPLAGLCQETGVEIKMPHVLHHDKTSNVLIIEDLGPLVTLWDILTPTAFKAALSVEVIHQICTKLGRRIGNFFGKVHSANTTRLLRESLDASQAQILEKNLTASVVFESAVKPILERLGTHVAPQKLYGRVVEDYLRDPLPEELCLSLGDCHPGAVLLPLWDQLASSNDGQPDLAVIDWEFSTSAGRGVNGDMAQLLASLHCHLLYLAYTIKNENTPSHAPEYQKALTATQGFVSGVCSAFAATSRFNLEVSVTNPTMTILRSTLILHGREMINQAVERVWQINGTDPELVEDMVAAGTWYIDMAGEDVGDMLETESWHALLKNEDRGIIKSLFGFEVMA